MHVKRSINIYPDLYLHELDAKTSITKVGTLQQKSNENRI
jgi:hypothetical protein